MRRKTYVHAFDRARPIRYDNSMNALTQLKGVGPKTVEKLQALGIESPRDLVEFAPKFYFDMTTEADLASARDGDYVLLRGRFTAIGTVLRMRRGLTFFRCTLSTASGKVKAVWFNAPFVRPLLDKEREFLVWGKAFFKKGAWELTNPSVEAADQNKRLQGIVPIYALKGAIAQNTFRNLVAQALPLYDARGVLDGRNGYTRRRAYAEMHDPSDMSCVTRACRHLAQESLVYQLIAYRLSKRAEGNAKPRVYVAPSDCIDACVAGLPYALTDSQRRALDEILSDLQSPDKTNRMLLGDVGSGKTVVALLSMLYAARCGYQSVLMCPTEILARQHFNTALAVYAGRGLCVRLLTGSTSAAERKEVYAGLADGTVDVVVGTHAVFSAAVRFERLGFVVIDELHRFGVRQKSALEDKTRRADVLIMSATPIPRTLALTLYGDLAMSTLQPRAQTGERIRTHVIGDDRLDDLYAWICRRVAAGEQAYIVCPLVEDCEGLEVFSAKMLYKRLASGALSGVRVGLIYGGLKDKAKQEVMTEFYRGNLDVLIATSVIEVGIDSPRASVMAVLNADRFGLAALHQLRGRVGRSPDLRSDCFLHTSQRGENARLQALAEHSDGFEIAEIDAGLRGYGDFLGVRQSGGGETRYLDRETVLECKTFADELLACGDYDPDEPILTRTLSQMQGVSLT